MVKEMPSVRGVKDFGLITLMDGAEDTFVLSDRERNSIGRHALNLFKKHLRLKMPQGSAYSVADILLPLLSISISNRYLETEYQQSKVVRNIFGKRVKMPSPDAIFRRVNECSVVKIHEAVRAMLRDCVEDMKKAGLIDTGVGNDIIVAIDYHNKKRYRKLRQGVKHRRDSADMKYAIGIKPKDGACYAHKYATCQIVGTKGGNVVLDFSPVTQFSSKREIMKELINNGMDIIGRKIDIVLGDGDFDDTDALRVFQELEVDYICHCGKNSRVKKYISSMGCEVVKFVKNFTIGKGKRSVNTNLIIVDKEWLMDMKICMRELPCDDRYYTFVTSLVPSPDETIYELALNVVKTYKKRWGIETGYRDIDSFMAMTHALSYKYRFLLFAIAIILYNLWRLWAHRLKNRIKDPITKDIMKILLYSSILHLYYQNINLSNTSHYNTELFITFKGTII